MSESIYVNKVVPNTDHDLRIVEYWKSVEDDSDNFHRRKIAAWVVTYLEETGGDYGAEQFESKPVPAGNYIDEGESNAVILDVSDGSWYSMFGASGTNNISMQEYIKHGYEEREKEKKDRIARYKAKYEADHKAA